MTLKQIIKTIVFVLLAVFPTIAFGQGVCRYDILLQTINNIASPVSYGSIQVCLAPGATINNGTCSPLANIYSSYTLSSASKISQPGLQTDINGNFYFCAVPGDYTVVGANSSFVQNYQTLPWDPNGTAVITAQTLNVTGTATFNNATCTGTCSGFGGGGGGSPGNPVGSLQTNGGSNTFVGIAKSNVNANNGFILNYNANSTIPSITLAIEQIVGRDNIPTVFEMDAANSFAMYMVSAAGGTIASPTALQSGARIGGIGAYGYTGSGYTGIQAGVFATADATWSSGSAPAGVDITGTPASSITSYAICHFWASGGVSCPGSLGDPGVGKFNIASGGAFEVNGVPVGGGGSPAGPSGCIQNNGGSSSFGCIGNSTSNSAGYAAFSTNNDGAAYGPVTGVVLQTIGADNTSNASEFDSFNDPSSLLPLRCDGTLSFPTATGSGEDSSKYFGGAFDGTTKTAGAGLIFATGDAWTGTDHGMSARLDMAQNGGTTLVNDFQVSAVDGGIAVPITVAGGSKGNGTINAQKLYQLGIEAPYTYLPNTITVPVSGVTGAQNLQALSTAGGDLNSATKTVRAHWSGDYTTGGTTGNNPFSVTGFGKTLCTSLSVPTFGTSVTSGYWEFDLNFSIVTASGSVGQIAGDCKLVVETNTTTGVSSTYMISSALSAATLNTGGVITLQLSVNVGNIGTTIDSVYGTLERIN